MLQEKTFDNAQRLIVGSSESKEQPHESGENIV